MNAIKRLRIAYVVFAISFTIGLIIVAHQNSTINKNRSIGQINNCAILKGLVKAGRDTILSGTQVAPPAVQEKFLRSIGFPPYAKRKAQAIKQANNYINTISDTVVKETGDKNGFAIKNNTVDCSRLREISGLSKKP